MDELTCPICSITIQPKQDRKEHLEKHSVTDPHMQKIALHLIKLEERVIALEKSKGYIGNEDRQRQHRKEKKDAQQPKAITMADELKNKALLQKKPKLGDGSHIAAEDR